MLDGRILTEKVKERLPDADELRETLAKLRLIPYKLPEKLPGHKKPTWRDKLGTTGLILIGYAGGLVTKRIFKH